MKKIIALLLLIATPALAQLDWTYSTNLYYAITYPTNIYIGSNGTDTAGDSWHVWVTKINAAHTLFWNHLQADEASIISASNNISSNTAEIANLNTNIWTVTQNSTTTTITNGPTRAFWFLEVQFNDAATGRPALTILRPGIRTNTVSPVDTLASFISTNIFLLPVNANTTNAMTDISGSGASVNVIDSHLER